ncbi:MAG: ATPase, T2SS/T4P/T4SS family [Patescibacteria group bacterium]
MTREDLAREIAKKTNLNIKKALKLAIAFADTVSETLEKGEKVIYSNFGSFYTVHYPSKTILHPKLGAAKKMIMLPTDVVKWMPADNIKEAVNRGLNLENCTSYGSFKKMHGDKSESKGEEIDIPPEKIKTNEDEEVDIPIKIIGEKVEAPEVEVKVEEAPREKAEVIKIKTIEPVEKDDADFVAPISHKDKKNKIPFVDLSHFTIPSSILAIIPESFAKNHRVVAIEDEDNVLVVAMLDAGDDEVIHLLEKVTGRTVEIKLADETGMAHVLAQYARLREGNLIVAVEPTPEFISSLSNEGKVAPVVRTVLNLIKKSVRDNATDIHFDPSKEEITMRFRIDGLLQKRTSLPKAMGNLLVRAFSLISSLDDDQTKPQTGKLKINIENETYEYSLATFPVLDGLKITMKLTNKLTALKNLGELEFSDKNFKLVTEACIDRSGIIMITGPSESGKSTLFYALIDQVYSEGINIVTLENPVKFRLPGINQTSISNPADRETAMSQVEKLDPDVIGITGADSRETVQKAFELAASGHFLIISMAGSSVAETIKRLYDWGISETKISELLKLVIFEKLSRRICDKCKKEMDRPLEDKLKNYIEKELTLGKTAQKIWLPIGCSACAESGFKGQIPLHEVVKINHNIVKQTLSGEPDDYDEVLRYNELSTIREDGLDKVLRGQTTLEELYKTLRRR